MPRAKLLWTVTAALLFMLIALDSAYLKPFVEQTRQGEETATAYIDANHPLSASYTELDTKKMSTDERKLLERIREGAKSRRVAPIDAKIDPVWKAIPGYNGLEVDIEATFKLCRDTNQCGKQWIMKEVEPAVQLDDLKASPIYKGNPRKPMVALMINVAWGDEYLPVMLDALETASVQATFFLDGTWLSKNEEQAKEFLNRGHQLSNHGYSHKNMSTLSKEQATREITRTQDLLGKLGVENGLFAPPSGDYDQETVAIADELGLKTVLWTLDTVDWKKPDPNWIAKRVKSRVEPGTMILMHPTESASQALPEIIEIIKNKGYVLGTVDDLLSSKRVPKSGE